ncbi:DUF1624 domain-containing protein [Aquimarina sp. U1-2]|uniref:heparan-alpha-glucosaminide N-acetyltransferase domain-containing protein n=1 Tax=Aquimarina sp. U1-2 TaxID=2823141 RepID=UPI001AECEBC1|nr:heparan-alpha-glucosaminide N-acetyltransferase domain-containing protein [Aquimarina sp. U1-2]MBP2832419.1 DUF1624 domain-containing protein [Aquimarina sp. U1-2]
MNKPVKRLYFLDAIRAFAIIMMLQGHFVHALLGDNFRVESNTFYTIWAYFRGVTAPLFFTITGFVFTYLLVRQQHSGFENPRVLKGIRRAIKVIFWGYLLRLSFFAVFEGTLNPSFFYVDVLQCIGTSLLLLIGLYLMIHRYHIQSFQYILLVLGLAIFILQPVYDQFMLSFLPQTISNYFTSKNGSIFTLFPWFGYVSLGGFIGMLFFKYKEHPKLYRYAILALSVVGIFLIFYSSKVFMMLHTTTGFQIFKSVAYNNFLFIRLGNVCILFAFFISIRNHISHSLITKIGSQTLSIYIVHFFVLYGSWFGLGLSRFFYHNLSLIETIIGAILFVIAICTLVLYYDQYKKSIKSKLYKRLGSLQEVMRPHILKTSFELKNQMIKKYHKYRTAKKSR